ncbi:MAG: iron-sulfur cluster carrier protein ApbC [Gammaproteobacteria bacterium]|nr:iron-sulfur cluster carrier protein ApbC [Gammaproteobacteria bacterium]MBP9729259.1 iron-sulfur cluster carrier protein ApbC [Gammaproteobacteria bacterium]
MSTASIEPVRGVKSIIAIGSGKGGVGKSTTAVNLALALHAEGVRVGLLDADIYGPNQPLLLGIHQQPTINADQRIDPVLQYGLQTMSMGYLLDEGAPLVWRGPMISKALQQMLYQTAWDALDYLIVDLPPGTGDITLTVAQKMPLCGAVIVTTPQDVAVLDAKKALLAFRKLEVPVLGLIENMSTHICSACGHAEAIFGTEGGERLASTYEVPFLGRLALDASIRIDADRGMPSVVACPEGPVAASYRTIARNLRAVVALRPKEKTVLKPVIIT